MSKTTTLVIAVILVFIAAVVYALFHLGEVNKREVVNRYYGSDYSFTYPLGYELQEDGRNILSIGSTSQAGFVAAVDLTTIPMPADRADFDAFVRERIVGLCATETPTERTSCTVISDESLKTVTGENAQVYHLTLTRSVPGQEPETRSYGPLYVYSIGPIEIDGVATFAALVVHNSLHTVLSGSSDSVLLTTINDSVQVGKSRD